VFKKVREALGFSKCKQMIVGAAPIHRETLEFFMSVDMPILELYGMSECTGPHTLNVKNFKQWRTGSCGQCISGVETKIDNPDEHGDGEVSGTTNLPNLIIIRPCSFILKNAILSTRGNGSNCIGVCIPKFIKPTIKVKLC